MTAGALCLGLILALRLGCVAPFAIPQDAGTGGRHEGQNRDALFHLRGLPQGPAVAPHKKAPQFMLDLFNAVSVPSGIPKSQKEILEGNIVRSFQDKGEDKQADIHTRTAMSFKKNPRQILALQQHQMFFS